MHFIDWSLNDRENQLSHKLGCFKVQWAMKLGSLLSVEVTWLGETARELIDTWCRSFVSFSGPAWQTSSDLIDGGDSKAEVHMSMKLQQSGMMVSRYSRNLSPTARLMLAFLKLYNKLCTKFQIRTVSTQTTKHIFSNLKYVQYMLKNQN